MSFFCPIVRATSPSVTRKKTFLSLVRELSFFCLSVRGEKKWSRSQSFAGIRNDEAGEASYHPDPATEKVA